MANIIQFGTGRFLRGFFAPLIQQEKSITVVQSRQKSEGASLINQYAAQGYHVWVRGKQDGQIVDQAQTVDSLQRALVANADWQSLQELATSSDVTLIVSNTTEAGLMLQTEDQTQFDFRNECPKSFPARLTALLFARFESGNPCLSILPMELVDNNADCLKRLVLQQAKTWQATAQSDFLDWLQQELRWLNNLVDRIVVSVTDDPPWAEHDPLAVTTEPYRLLAIQDDQRDRSVLPDHPSIQWVGDLQPVYRRKVRILNGLHTAMVAHCLPSGFETVLDAVSDPQERKWLESLLNDEILKVLQNQGQDESQYAQQVFERFENPFFKHRLADIANGHEQKLETRLKPTFDDYVTAFADEPNKLKSLLNL